MKWTKRVIRYATKNRKSPAENRRRVGKSLSLLSVFVFAVFWSILLLLSGVVVNLEQI